MEPTSKFDLILAGVQKFMKRGATAHLTNMINKLHPADVSRVLEHLESAEEKKELFDLVRDIQFKAYVLKELDPHSRSHLLDQLSDRDIASLLRQLSSDDVAEVMDGLQEEKREAVLNYLALEDSRKVQSVLAYPEETAGRLMNTDFLAMREDATVDEAVKQVREAKQRQIVFYLYVTNKEDRLVGVVSLRELLISPPGITIKRVMNPEVITVSADADQEEVARLVTRYNLLAIPVVDGEHRIEGIVTFDDVIDVLREEATEDIYKLAGAGSPEEALPLQASSLKTARFRLPWLLTTLFGTILSGGILWTFRLTLQEVVALVTFIPVIAAMGGTVGIQSSTVVVSGLATGRIEPAHLWRVFARELKVGLFMAVLCGLVVGAVAFLWYDHPMLGVVLAGAMFLAITVAAVLGALAPVTLNKLGIDPAISSGPFVTTFNDIMSLAIYLGLATLLLEYLQ